MKTSGALALALSIDYPLPLLLIFYVQSEHTSIFLPGRRSLAA